jgi:hypothetical protein
MLAREHLLLLGMRLMGVKLMCMATKLSVMKRACGSTLTQAQKLLEYIVMRLGLG